MNEAVMFSMCCPRLVCIHFAVLVSDLAMPCEYMCFHFHCPVDAAQGATVDLHMVGSEILVHCGCVTLLAQARNLTCKRCNILDPAPKGNFSRRVCGCL